MLRTIDNVNIKIDEVNISRTSSELKFTAAFFVDRKFSRQYFNYFGVQENENMP